MKKNNKKIIQHMYVRAVLVCVIAKERRTNYDARFLTVEAENGGVLSFKLAELHKRGGQVAWTRYPIADEFNSVNIN